MGIWSNLFNDLTGYLTIGILLFIFIGFTFAIRTAIRWVKEGR